MPNKKSLTERVSERFSEIKKAYSPKLKNAIFDAEVRFAYLQESLKGIVPKANKENIRNIAFNLFTIPTLAITYSVSALASEQISLEEYIEQNQYDLSTILQLRLKSLNENGLDDFEKEFIDLLQGLPEDKQKDYAKDVYDNGFTQELLEKIRMWKGSGNSINGLEEKVTQEPENPVDIYAVIANGTNDKKSENSQIISMLMFYKLLKDVGVSDDNITLLLYHPNHEDFIHTEKYEELKEDYGEHFVLVHIPSDKSQVDIDDENVTLEKFLKAISNIPSDDNDIVYISYSSYGTKKGKVKFPGGYLGSQELERAIKIDYGKLFIMQDSYYGGALLKNLKATKNCIAIASSLEDSQSAAGTIPYILVEYFRKNPNAPMGKLIIDISEKLLRSGSSPLMAFCSSESFLKSLLDEPFIPEGYSLN